MSIIVVCGHLSTYPSVSLSAHVLVYLPICMSLWPVMCLEVIGEDKLRVILCEHDPCICLSIPFIHLSICLPIYLSIIVVCDESGDR